MVIRGATTVKEDTKEEISFAVGELLDNIFAENALRPGRGFSDRIFSDGRYSRVSPRSGGKGARV